MDHPTFLSRCSRPIIEVKQRRAWIVSGRSTVEDSGHVKLAFCGKPRLGEANVGMWLKAQ